MAGVGDYSAAQHKDTWKPMGCACIARRSVQSCQRHSFEFQLTKGSQERLLPPLTQLWPGGKAISHYPEASEQRKTRNKRKRWGKQAPVSALLGEL